MGVDSMTFGELVQALTELEREREQSGEPLDIERTMRRRAIDERLVKLLSKGGHSAPVGESDRRDALRVPSPMGMKIHVGDHTVVGNILDLGEGGMRVNAPEALQELSTVELQLVSEPPLTEDRQPPPVRARISWVRERSGAWEFGLQFVNQSERHRNSMRRLMVEILRRMTG